MVSLEHRRVALVAPAEVAALTMPDGYKRSIRTWLGMLAGETAGAAGPSESRLPGSFAAPGEPARIR